MYKLLSKGLIGDPCGVSRPWCPVVASSKPGPFAEFYAALVGKGMRPEMARLTLARKIATIVLIVWKKEPASTPNI
jgi:hypothetical protein